jgi:hypothetical protein
LPRWRPTTRRWRRPALLDASGLQPSAKGWRIQYSGDKRTFVDGPFAETKELVAGYTLIQVKSREEAMEWTRRFPNPDGKDGEIEVRQLFELEDFGPSEAVERFRKMGIGVKSHHRSMPISGQVARRTHRAV